MAFSQTWHSSSSLVSTAAEATWSDLHSFQATPCRLCTQLHFLANQITVIRLRWWWWLHFHNYVEKSVQFDGCVCWPVCLSKSQIKRWSGRDLWSWLVTRKWRIHHISSRAAVILSLSSVSFWLMDSLKRGIGKPPPPHPCWSIDSQHAALICAPAMSDWAQISLRQGHAACAST